MMEKLREQLYPFVRKCISQIDTIRVILFIAILVCGSGGVFYGYFLAKASFVPATPMSWVEDIGFSIPVLAIEGYSENEVVFKTDKLGTRIVMGEKILSAPPNTLFKVQLDEKLRAPAQASSTGATLAAGSSDGANAACPFVAGTTGKYVYPEADSRAKRLKTRRCFGTQEEAVAAGLLVPEK